MRVQKSEVRSQNSSTRGRRAEAGDSRPSVFSGSRLWTLHSTLGFTLVELLVVVVIMLILAGLTLSAINFGMTGERISAGARQMQSFLEGARDRAIYAKELRGVRLLVDETNPRTVTSMVYIGAPELYSEGMIWLERPDNNNDQKADNPSVTVVRGFDTSWYLLKQRGMLGIYEDLNGDGKFQPKQEDLNKNGVFDLNAPRIRIPGDKTGTWYTVLTNRLTASNEVLLLTTPYRDPGTTEATGVLAFESGGPNTYQLELPPRVLPNEDPALLPSGIVIDLDGSKIPSSWRPGPGSPITTPYSSHMDIMFSPSGVVVGAAASAGLIHFYLAEPVDVDKTVSVLGRTSNSWQVGQAVPGEVFKIPDDPVGDRRVVTLFTRTGKISTHPIRPDDYDTDNFADDPFFFAETGEEVGQ